VLCEKKSEVRDNDTGNVMTSTWLLSSALLLLLLAAMPQLLHSQRGNDEALHVWNVTHHFSNPCIRRVNPHSFWYGKILSEAIHINLLSLTWVSENRKAENRGGSQTARAELCRKISESTSTG